MSHLKASSVKMSHHSLKKRILLEMCTLMSPRFLMNIQGEHHLFSYIIFKFLIRFSYIYLFCVIRQKWGAHAMEVSERLLGIGALLPLCLHDLGMEL